MWARRNDRAREENVPKGEDELRKRCVPMEKTSRGENVSHEEDKIKEKMWPKGENGPKESSLRRKWCRGKNELGGMILPLGRM
jgi:hypothetical protein